MLVPRIVSTSLRHRVRGLTSGAETTRLEGASPWLQGTAEALLFDEAVFFLFRLGSLCVLLLPLALFMCFLRMFLSLRCDPRADM